MTDQNGSNKVIKGNVAKNVMSTLAFSIIAIIVIQMIQTAPKLYYFSNLTCARRIKRYYSYLLAVDRQKYLAIFQTVNKKKNRD